MGLLLLGLARLVAVMGGTSDIGLAPEDAVGFDFETGVPLVLTTVVKLNVLSLLEVAFAFTLLLRFRDLVQFKRTRRSLRNWHVMLGLMGVVSLLTFLKPGGEELGLALSLGVIPAVGLMVVNVFRVSWVVYLSFWEKLAIIGLSLLLLAVLSAGLGLGYGSHLQYYSYPLSLFSMLAVVFGILYSLTSFLSLLFHLPTTGDFQRKAGEMAAMHSLTTLVGQVFDPQRLAATITASPVETGAANAAWLALADPQSGSLRPRIAATHGIAPERAERLVDTAALYADVAARGERLMLEEAPTDHRVAARPGDGLGRPPRHAGSKRGASSSAPSSPRTRWRTGSRTTTWRPSPSSPPRPPSALDNARLFEEQLERGSGSRASSTSPARCSGGSSPSASPSSTASPSPHASVSAQEVGGDYYDFAARSPTAASPSSSATSSGKGTSAAFYMAELQGIFQSVSRLAPSPAAFLGHANEALAAALERNVFISVVYGVLDPEREEVALARAGHCPAALITLGGEARLLRSKGIGLGLDPGRPLPEHAGRGAAPPPARRRPRPLHRRRRREPEPRGARSTGTTASSTPSAGTATRRHTELHEALLGDLHRFIGHETYDDDMTLVVLKWHGRVPLDGRLDGRPLTGVAQTPDPASSGEQAARAPALRPEQTPSG